MSYTERSVEHGVVANAALVGTMFLSYNFGRIVILYVILVINQTLILAIPLFAELSEEPKLNWSIVLPNANLTIPPVSMLSSLEASSSLASKDPLPMVASPSELYGLARITLRTSAEPPNLYISEVIIDTRDRHVGHGEFRYWGEELPLPVQNSTCKATFSTEKPWSAYLNKMTPATISSTSGGRFWIQTGGASSKVFLDVLCVESHVLPIVQEKLRFRIIWLAAAA